MQVDKMAFIGSATVGFLLCFIFLIQIDSSCAQKGETFQLNLMPLLSNASIFFLVLQNLS